MPEKRVINRTRTSKRARAIRLSQARRAGVKLPSRRRVATASKRRRTAALLSYKKRQAGRSRFVSVKRSSTRARVLRRGGRPAVARKVARTRARARR